MILGTCGLSELFDRTRYYIRAIAPPAGTEGQIWLEAYPRTREEAANFSKATLILTASNMQPFALQLQEPNGKTRQEYSFYDIKVNDNLGFLRGNPFAASTPFGWKKVVHPAPIAQVQRGAAPADTGRLR